VDFEAAKIHIEGTVAGRVFETKMVVDTRSGLIQMELMIP